MTVDVNGQAAGAFTFNNATPTSTGTTPDGQSYAIYPVTVTVSDSQPQLDVGVDTNLQTGSGAAFGVDNVAVALHLVPPQQFAVSLPASFSNGQPLAGAGNLETTASEDDYNFSTSAAATVAVDFNQNDCPNYSLDWALVDTSSGSTVYSSGSCGHSEIPNVPAGSYQLQVSKPGSTGTYDGSIQLKPAPQQFVVSLPAAFSNDVPSPGAGNLETTTSEDDYNFSTSAAATVAVDFNQNDCPNYSLNWKLVDTSSGSTVYSSGSCGHSEIPNVSAGSYQLQVSKPGSTGTYDGSIQLKPAPDSFNLSLPASFSNGQPSAGAGNLETTASEDDYNFSTSAAATVAVDFNQNDCPNYSLDWALVDTSSGSTVYSSGSCGHSEIPNVPAGSYQLQVSKPGSTGTYDGSSQLKPAPDSFNLSLPASFSNGQPSAGAGNLETTASEDDYNFSTSAAATVAVDFNQNDCPNYSLDWALVDTSSGSTVYSSGSCGHSEIPNVPAGSYQLQVSKPGSTGTYDGTISLVPALTVASVNPGRAVRTAPPGGGGAETSD